MVALLACDDIRGRPDDRLVRASPLDELGISMAKRKKPLLNIEQLIRVVELARFHLHNCAGSDEAAELDIEAVELWIAEQPADRKVV